MLLDRALRTTFRNFSTLFLLVAIVSVTAHLLYGIVFRDVLAVTELHPYIAELKFGRQVNDVAARDLRSAEMGRWVLFGVQALFLPLLVPAARRILVRDEHDEVPTVPDAILHPREPRGRLGFAWRGGELLTVVVGLLLAATVWYLTQRIGLLAAEPLPDRLNFLAFELVRGVAVALAAPFLLGSLVTAALSAGERRRT
ncbi:MAG: hypothetical protein M3174_04455 [Actinomycetota bacterium]|nr:hypothetical protein [Actinomycetota bacterium]